MMNINITYYESVTEANRLLNELIQNIYSVSDLKYVHRNQIAETYFRYFLLASNDEGPVAAIAVYHNPYLKYKDENVLVIGNYECINDQNVSNILFAEISQKALHDGFSYLIGPMNGSTWNNYRFSTTHHNPPFFLEPFNHLYYNDLFIGSGFKPIAQYAANISRQLKFDDELTLKKQNEFIESGICFRNVDLNNFESEIKIIFELSINAFKDNFLYSPMSWDDFRNKYLLIKEKIRPEHIILAEDKNKCVGFIFGIQDLYNQNEKSFIVKSMARDRSEPYKGLGNVLGNMIIKMTYENGYSSVIHAFIFEQNVTNVISENYSGMAYNKYALYGKSTL